MNLESLRVFALNATCQFGSSVAHGLGIELSKHEEREFEDGEHKTRPLESVRGRDVFVVQSLYSDREQSVNDKLCRLLFFLGALRDASARRVTAVIPYLGYARKDRKSQTRDPVTTRYVATILEAAGADHVIAFEVHNVTAFQNAFRVTTDHLESKVVFADHFAELFKTRDRITVLSPDPGGIKRANAFRSSLEQRLGREVSTGFMEKTRALGVMTPGQIVGDIEDRSVIIFDDLISTGGTIAEASKMCKRLGANEIYAAAAHGVFVGRSEELLSNEYLDRVAVTDTIPPFRLTSGFVEQKLTILQTAPLFAEAIKRVHTGGSVVELIS
jgi:ribose-phosphate pyrophosphokinase